MTSRVDASPPTRVAPPSWLQPGAGALDRLLAAAPAVLRAAAASGGAIVPGGPPVTATISDPGGSVSFSFGGSAGQRVSVRATSASFTGYRFSCCAATLVIYDASGRAVSGYGGGSVWLDPAKGGFLDTVPLPAAGSYSVVVAADTGVTGSVTLTLHDVPADPAPVVVPTAAGGTVSMTTTVPGQNMSPTFSGRAGERLSVWVPSAAFADSQYSCCAAQLGIYDAAGKLVRGFNGSTEWIESAKGGAFLDIVPLPSDGTYTIFIDGQGTATGSVTISAFDVPADPAPVLTPSTSGARVSMSTTVRGQNMSPTFTGRAGQRVSVWVRSSAFVDAAFPCCAARVGIHDSTGQLVQGTNGSLAWVDATKGGFLDTVVLPATGTYTALVDGYLMATGSVTLTLYDVPADPAPALAPSASGASASLTTTVPGQNMAPTFAGRAGERVSVWVRTSSFSNASYSCCAATVVIARASDGGAVGGSAYVTAAGGGFLDPVTLPADASYVVRIDPGDVAVGSVTITVYDVPADLVGTLAVGAPWRAAIPTPGQNASAAFLATGGDSIKLALTNVAFSGSGSDTCCAVKVTLYQGSSTVGIPTYIGTSGGTISRTLAGSGTSVYRVVLDPQAAATGSLTLTLTGATSAIDPLAQSFGPGVCLNGQGVDAISATACLVDPVNTWTGAFTTSERDVSLASTGFPFAFTRNYTSADLTQGRLGPGWRDSYSAFLVVQPNGDAVVHSEDGQQVYFTKQADGSFVGGAGTRSTLSVVSGGYLLVRRDRLALRFDGGGVLQTMRDRNAQGLTFGHDAGGRLTTVTDSAGHAVTFAYTADDLLGTVSTPDGRTVTYGYTNGRLTSVSLPDPDGAGPLPRPLTRYAYDAAGRLATETDANDHTVFGNVYDEAGRVTRQTDASGKVTLFEWDPAMQTATVTDPDKHVWKDVYANGILVKRISGGGDVTKFGHDADLNVNSVTSPNGSDTTTLAYSNGNLVTAMAPASLGSVQKRFTYDAQNNVRSVLDARNNLTEYAYDSAGNLTSVKLNGRQVLAATYDARGQRLTTTDGNGKQTRYAYDPNGNLASVVDPLGDKTTFTYDALGNVLTKVSPLGNCAGCDPAAHTMAYAYDALGRLLTERDALGHTTSYAHDAVGNRVSVTDAKGHTTRYEYDNANRLVRVVEPDPDGTGPLAAPVTTYLYDDAGNRIADIDLGGGTTRYTYDANNRVASIVTPRNETTTYTHDASGNLASVVDPRGNVPGCGCASRYTTRYVYDAAGRLLTTTDPLGHTTTNHYDAVGNLDWTRDAKNQQTSLAYDAQGRVLSVSAPDGGVTVYAYDAAGNLLTRTDDNQHTTRYAYDDAGRLTQITGADPDGSGPQTAPVTTYGYDADGNRTSMVDPNGSATPTQGDGTTTYVYDRAGRLTGVRYSDATPPVTFALDAVGNRSSMTDGSGTVTYAYDALDRLTSASRGTSTFSYGYDAAGNVASRTYPDSTQVTYGHDEDNRLTSVSAGGATTTYSYDPAGHLVQTVLPASNGNVETRTYDEAGRLTEVKAATAGGILADFAATLDAVGNPTQIIRSGATAGTSTFTYDAADRLTGVCFKVGTCPKASDPFIRWTYDRVGNRLSEARPGATTAYAYDALDELTQAGTTSYTYDRNGNVAAAGSTSFVYDLENRLRSVTSGTTTTTYAYDGDGNRLQTSNGSAASKKVNFSWDVTQPIPQVALERDGANALLRRYVYGVQRVSMATPADAFYYHLDLLGSVANVTSSAGAREWTYAYEPFGPTKSQTKNDPNAPTNLVKFAGEYLDPTGLYHLRARQYDPTLGRFLQVDPAASAIGGRYESSYVYAADQPTVLVDPSGRTVQSSDAGLCASRAAASGADSSGCLGFGSFAPLGGPEPGLVYPFPLGVPKQVVQWVHPTGGLPGYPGIDFGAPAGATVLAVTTGTTRWATGDGTSNGGSLANLDCSRGIYGYNFYLRSSSTGVEYFYTHLQTRLVRNPGFVVVGQKVGTIVNWLATPCHKPNHLHLGASDSDPSGPNIRRVYGAPQVAAP